MNDEGYFGRVYRTSAIVWLFGVLAAWAVAGIYAAFGWTMGSAISVGLLAGIEWIVRTIVRPGNVAAKKALTKVAALHWPIIVGVLALAIWLSGRRVEYIVAFAAGLGLAQAVIVLKAVGAVIVDGMNKE